jgi:hypothetical protein
VEHADERRALAAHGNIVPAEIVDHAHPGLLGKQPRIGELPADLLAGNVPNRVAMEADEVGAFDRFLRQRLQ